jgi:hypothetical protein
VRQRDGWKVGGDVERLAADRCDARDPHGLTVAEELERVRRRLHDRADGEPARVEPGLEPERPQAHGDVLERGGALGDGGADRRLELGGAVVVVEAERPERGERRVREPEPVVADDEEAGAPERLTRRRMDDPRQRELTLERLPVGAETHRDPERRELARGDLVQPLPRDLPDDGVLALAHPVAKVTSERRGT